MAFIFLGTSKESLTCIARVSCVVCVSFECEIDCGSIYCIKHGFDRGNKLSLGEIIVRQLLQLEIRHEDASHRQRFMGSMSLSGAVGTNVYLFSTLVYIITNFTFRYTRLPKYQVDHQTETKGIHRLYAVW